jgi:hypothetical protein
MAQDCEQSLEGPGNYCRFRDELKLCYAYNTAQAHYTMLRYIESELQKEFGFDAATHVTCYVTPGSVHTIQCKATHRIAVT